MEEQVDLNTDIEEIKLGMQRLEANINRVLQCGSDCTCCSQTKRLRTDLDAVASRLEGLKDTADGILSFEKRFTEMQTKMSELQQTLLKWQTNSDNAEDTSQIARGRSEVENRREAQTPTSSGISKLQDGSTENSPTSVAGKNTTELTASNDPATLLRSDTELTLIKQPQRKVFQTQDAWISLAKHEIDIATLLTGDVGSVVTVLLIDISESMAVGDAWVQTRTFVKEYLKGLQEIRSLEGASGLDEEYIAIATFGHETRLQVYLTTDYGYVVEYMDHVRLGGPSPLFGGLWIATLMACKGRPIRTNGIIVVPKIIVISDFRPTETLLVKGPDIPNGETIDESMTDILSTLEEINKDNISMFFVTVGNSNKDFVDLIKSIDTNVYSFTDGRRLARRYYLSTRAASFDITAFLFNFRRRPVMSSEDQADMFAIRMESHRRSRSFVEQRDPKILYHESASTILPMIGSRVRRGPDWRNNNQDGNGPGTVVGHSEEDSSVYVCWDADSRYLYVQRYGENGYDVLVTGEHRTLKPGDKIDVGCTVKPGRDGQFEGFYEWNTGVVIRVDPPKAHVRWDSGSRGDYSYGEDEKYEIEICSLTRGDASGVADTHVPARPTDKTEVKPEHTTRKNKNKKLDSQLRIQ